MEQLNKKNQDTVKLFGINIFPGCGCTVNVYMCKCPTS